jgi:guanyl-specific ribonuclease Sa
MKKTAAGALAALASLLLIGIRFLAPTAGPTPAVTMGQSAGPTAPATRETRAPDPGPRSLGDASLDRQVALVVESMDRTGHPPAGVAQGGRRGRARGTFENAEGRLPAQPPGYYTETDVWPRGASGRGTQRLIFGRGGEVYYTADHYRTFARVRSKGRAED